MKVYSSILTGLLIFTTLLSFGQPGTLDGDFDADGKVTTDLGPNAAVCWALAIQQDGKIIAVGSSGDEFATVRYQPDGSLDNSFGSNGKVITTLEGQDYARCVALQQDGKILIAGSVSADFGITIDFGLIRYNSDGSTDNSFSFDGIVVTDLGGIDRINSMELQPDGKIVVAGSSSFDFAVARYNVDGSLDNTFSLDGKVTTDFGNSNDVGRSVSLQSDGKIVVVGQSYISSIAESDFASVRYNSDGSLDSTYGTNGKVLTDFSNAEDRAWSSAIQSDGKIILAGHAVANGSASFALLRYNTDGTLDNTFTNGGKVTTSISIGYDLGHSIALQPDDKILIAGVTSSGNGDFALARYTPDGLLDITFQFGHVTTQFGNDYDEALAVAVQPDGKIVVGGTSDLYSKFALARYISGLNLGVISFSNQDNGMLIYPNPIKESATIEYTLTTTETLSLDLYNLSGKLVQSLFASEKRSAGRHIEPIALSAQIASGSYVLTLSNERGSSSVRITK
ncbi:MAG: T9SS type A sorting domain-containing protein [Saprospiraceae bacterium]|nr:T9SS type A sorting domain-containing protein [Saprospiraceae bacterium]